MVLLHRRAREPTDVLKAARRAVRTRLCCGAIELLKRWFRHVEVRAQDVPEDEPLERSIVGADDLHILDGIPDRLRERLLGRPELDLAVVQRPRHAEHLRRRVTSVGVDAPLRQVAVAAGFKIEPDHVLISHRTRATWPDPMSALGRDGASQPARAANSLSRTQPAARRLAPDSSPCV
jgi:hypothetical protein